MKIETEQKIESFFWGTVLLLVLYTVFSVTVYAFKNPDLNQTQIILNIFEAITWK